MPACGQAVGCGVGDTPELWRGAAGLCARVRACAGAAESLHPYISICILRPRTCTLPSRAVFGLGLTRSIYVHLHLPRVKGFTLLRNIRPPPTTLVYAIHHTQLVLAISCKGQTCTRPSRAVFGLIRTSGLTYITTVLPTYLFLFCAPRVKG